MATVLAAPLSRAPPQPGGSSANNCQTVIGFAVILGRFLAVYLP